MQTSPVPVSGAPARPAQPLVIGLLLLLCAPWGFAKLLRRRARVWILVPYALVGVPVFLVLYGFLGLLAFSAFLPDLDLSVSEHAPRTVRFAEGNYESTLLKTARDTQGAHEFIRIEIQPHGGNSFHYHRTFDETFTAVEGELTVHVGKETTVLKPGESITAPRGVLHTFRNATDQVVALTVRVEPAKGLEKSIRVAYGLSNTNMWNGASRMRNMWRIVLMMAYSETYLPGLPSLFQEPLIGALARIAQWRGEDEELKQFFAQPPPVSAPDPAAGGAG